MRKGVTVVTCAGVLWSMSMCQALQYVSRLREAEAAKGGVQKGVLDLGPQPNCKGLCHASMFFQSVQEPR